MQGHSSMFWNQGEKLRTVKASFILAKEEMAES